MAACEAWPARAWSSAPVAPRWPAIVSAARGEVVVHAREVERADALADIGAAGDELIIADTREQVAAINAVIRDRRHEVGERDGEPSPAIPQGG